jgi:hypothetical protein
VVDCGHNIICFCRWVPLLDVPIEARGKNPFPMPDVNPFDTFNYKRGGGGEPYALATTKEIIRKYSRRRISVNIGYRNSIKDGNMKKHFLISVCCIFTMISLLLSSPAILNAETFKLRYKDKEFPVSINFPTTVVKVIHKVLPLPNSISLDYYAFIAEDNTYHQTYGISVTLYPNSLGEIKRQLAQEMVGQSLFVQINSMNAALKIESWLLEVSEAPFAGYPSKYIALKRDTAPKTFSYYRGVFFNRFMVTAWSTGLDIQKNRNMATGFIKSLKLGNGNK